MVSQITSLLFTQTFLQVQIKEYIKAPVTGRCVWNSPITGEFPAQIASNAENVYIWWRHHVPTLSHFDSSTEGPF